MVGPPRISAEEETLSDTVDGAGAGVEDTLVSGTLRLPMIAQPESW